METQTGLSPTPSSSSVSQVPSNVPIPSSPFTFTNVPDQIFTCTNQLITWNSTGIFSDPNSEANHTIEEIYPLSLLTIDITGTYISSVPDGVAKPLTLPLFTGIVSETKNQTNITFNPMVAPPGTWAFIARLFISSGTQTSPPSVLIPIMTYTFTSPTFMVLNGTTTDCVIFSQSQPIASSPSGPPVQTVFPSQDLSSASNHLNGGAIAGITIGSIVAALLLFLIVAFLRLRSTRSYTISKIFGRMGVPGILKPSARRERRDTGDFIGLQSFDSSHVPQHAARHRQV